MNPSKTNSIVGVVYRHPIMDQTEFIHYHLQNLVNKLSKENKPVYIAGDWNFNLLNYSKHDETLLFFDTMMSNLFAPAITIPTRVNDTGGTLIDNIFTNDILPDRKSGNLIVAISDHYPSFFVIPQEPETNQSKSSVRYKRDKRTFSRENYILDFLEIDWDNVLQLHKQDVNFSTEKFMQTIMSLIDKHMPLKEMTKKKRKKASQNALDYC